LNSLALLIEDLRDDDLRAAARRHAEQVEAAIAEHLAAAMERGEIAPGDVARLARLAQAAWNGAVIQWALRGEGSLEGWLGEQLDTLFSLASPSARALSGIRA